MESDIDHPTNVKTWMIFAKGKLRVHAAMKCVWLSPLVLIRLDDDNVWSICSSASKDANIKACYLLVS